MYVVKNNTPGNLNLWDGAIRLAPEGEDSWVRLPQWARNHKEIEEHERKETVEVIPGSEFFGEEESATTEEAVEEESTETEEVVEEPVEPEDSTNETDDEGRGEEAEVAAETNDEGEDDAEEEEEVNDEVETNDEPVMPLEEFKDLTAKEMKAELRELGEADNADLRSKDKMVEHYEEHVV